MSRSTAIIGIPDSTQALDLGVLPVDAHQHDAVHSVMARPSDVRVGAAVARSRLLGREQEQVVSVGRRCRA